MQATLAVTRRRATVYYRTKTNPITSVQLQWSL